MGNITERLNGIEEAINNLNSSNLTFKFVQKTLDVQFFKGWDISGINSIWIMDVSDILPNNAVLLGVNIMSKVEETVCGIAINQKEIYCSAYADTNPSSLEAGLFYIEEV